MKNSSQPLFGLCTAIALLILISLSSCDSGPKPLMEGVNGRIDIKLNPYNVAPLGAQLTFTTKEACRVDIKVTGPIPMERSFSGYSTNHRIPVLGLYPDTTNTVEIELVTESGTEYSGELYVTTNALPDFLPDIDIVTVKKDKMEPGLHLAEVLIANNGQFDAFPVMFDNAGKVRWFLDLSGVKPFPFTPHRLKNGNWLFVSWVEIYELSSLGQLIQHHRLTDYSADHDVIALNNGHLIMGASKKDTRIARNGELVESRFDHVIEVDEKRNVVRDWDLREFLDVDRSVFREDFSLNFSADWFHINSIAYDPSDEGLAISGRNQGVLKVNGKNELQWILAPHRAWGKAGFDGQGLNTRDYLLSAVDGQGNKLPEEVQQGTASTDDFSWPTGQHALTVLDNGHLLMFDNGLARNFSEDFTYSRAVEFEIDPQNKTIRQVWEYGKERGLDMFSAITSDVDVLPNTNNRLITAGNVRLGALPPHAKMVEVTYPANEVVFEANLFLKDAKGTGAREWAQFDLLYRGERYTLY